MSFLSPHTIQKETAVKNMCLHIVFHMQAVLCMWRCYLDDSCLNASTILKLILQHHSRKAAKRGSMSSLISRPLFLNKSCIYTGFCLGINAWNN